MINPNCLVMTSERKKLHSQFPKLPPKIFRDYVSRWQYEYGREGETPTKDELIRLITKVSDNWADYINPNEIKVTNIYARANQNTILSNFANRPFFLTNLNGGTADEQALFSLLHPVLEYEHLVFSSVEQAFQMMKMLLPSMQEFTPEALANGITAEEKARIDKADAIVEKMKKTNNSSTLKRLGATRGILTDSELQIWDSNKKAIMKALIRASLKQNPKALQALLATGNSSLTHIQDRSMWRTQFPIILEELREEFRGSDYINLDNFMTVKSDKVIVMQAKKPWRSDPSRVNDTMRIYLKSKPEIGYFEVVKDEEDNYYSVHFKPEDKDNPNAWSNEEKEILFQAVADILPSGAYLSTWGELSKGGIAGLNRFGNLGFTEVERREVKTKKGGDSGITIPVWKKNETTASEASGYIINEHEGKWTRDEVENDPRTLYIFTDNTDRTSGGEEIGDGWYAEKYGKGGFGTVNNPTSAVIRGLPNAAPISTMKWFYREHGVSVEQARWVDADLEEFKEVIDDEIEQIKQLWDSGNFDSIELPQNGIFGKSIKSDKDRSISRLTATRTPKLYQYLNKKLQELSEYVQDTKKAKEYESESSSIDESNWHKVDAEFTSIKKRQRINLINDLFTQEVEKAQEATVTRLNAEMAKTSTIGKKLMLAKAIKNLRPFVVIKQERPFNLFDKVKAIFEDLLYVAENNRQAFIDREVANMENTRESKLPLPVKKRIAESRANYYIEAYKQILDNWNDLVMDAANTYSYDHGVIMDVTANDIEEDIDNTPTDDEGNNQNEQIADDKEETPYKEGWQVKVRELSAFESMTNQVRQAIGRIYRRDRNGDIVVDDLGFPQKLQQSYVFAKLISALRDMTNAKQMIPMLEALQVRKPWAAQIVDAIKNDERLFTSFYRVFRKDYLNMWIQIESTAPDGSVTIKTHNINKPTGTAHYFDEWRDNFEYGIVLDEDSIYDHNGEIRLDKAELGLKLVDAVMDKFRGLKSKEEKQQVILENVENLHKLLSMLGVSVTPDTLTDILTFNVNLNSKAELPGSIVLSNLRTIFKDMPTNDGIKNGEPADLINIYGRAFNNIATAINNVEEDEVESSVRQGKKTLYAHTRPSYATTLVKKLRSPEFKEFIESEYKPVDFLYDKEQGRWLNSLIDDLENDADARDKFNHIVVIEHNRKEYQQWTPLDTFLTLFNQYNAEPIKGGEGYAWYQMPLLSDATSAEFLRAKRVRKNYEEVLLDKFADVVRQEYNRIITVKQRNNTPNIKKIAYYDMTDDDAGGAKFHFFPKLNTEAFNNKDGKTFFEQLAEVADDTDAFNQRAKEAVQTIMNEDFIAALDNWASIGVFDRVDENNENSSFRYFKQRTRENVEAALREYYWNTTYMQSQIIQLMTTDLAYYGNYTNFTKRALEFHSPTEKLNTLAKWNGEYVLASEDENGNVTVRPERVIYLTDEVKPSNWMKDIEEIIDQKIAKGELTEYDKTVILKKWGDTNVTDAQAFRTLKSFRATQIAADMWSDDAETAYNNIRNNTWTAQDFVVLWNTRKPYLYTQINQSDRVGGIMRLAVQHKNSEMIMLTQAIFGSILHQSGKLKGLSEFMEDKNIDVAMFGTAVKVGGQGFIDLNGIESAEDVKSKLQKEVYIEGTDTINPEVVHEYNWDDYGIQVATPEHGINAIQLVGTQIRRLIGTDMGADATFKVGNKSLTRDQWRDYFNAVNTANIREAFEKLDKKFRDPKNISDLLISEIKSNSRYSNDLIEAVTLDENGQFNIPIFDPSQSQKIQELLNSIVKSRIVKQKINGGSLIQASAWALNEKDRPQIVWGKDKNGQKYIKYMEAYIPCPDDRLYELLLEDDGSININKKDSKGNYIVPAKYREAIGYRIPTEDKYSMIPIRVKGFLPRQVGSVIILPEEITTTTGSDFDKLSMSK